MTRNRKILGLIYALGAIAVAAPGSATAQSFPDRCTVDYASTVLSNGAAENLCECRIVTRGFIRHLQRHPDFIDNLTMYEDRCPGLAVVLSDTPTATIPIFGASDGRDETSSREEISNEENEEVEEEEEEEEETTTTVVEVLKP